MSTFRTLSTILLVCGLAALSTSCSDDSPSGVDDTDTGSDIGDTGADTGETPAPLTWRDPVEFQVEAEFSAAHPEAFARMSRWVTRIDSANRPPTGAIGGYGVGNGHVFALFGYGNPANAMHTMAGPTYDRYDGFFGDYALSVAVSGATVAPVEEWTARALSAPVVTTRTDVGDIVLDTVDFAPWTDGPERFCMVRMLSLTNVGGDAIDDVAVRVDANNFAYEEGGILVERRDARTMATRGSGETVTEDRRMELVIGELAAGERAERLLLHCSADGLDAPDEPSGTPGDWLDATAEAYAQWESHLADFSLADPMLDDFVEGMKMTLITQTTSAGASCPMSQYTGTWARDNIGPTLAWHAYGGFEEVRAMIDYIYGAILIRGDLSNSYEGALDLSDLPDAPDWDAMPDLSGRVGAETPSYVVWMYADHARHTGSLDFIADRWRFLHRTLFRQEFSDDDLLTFTDDETYRAAMNAAQGLALEYPHSSVNDSANSSLLWLGAARRYEWLSDTAGADQDAADAATRFAEVEEATLDAYELEDGCIGAFRERETGYVAPPFEDVALKALWGGWLDGDSERATASIACLIERLGVEPGVIRSALDEMYDGIEAAGGGEGVLTGMLPGYTLSALTSVGHPDAAASLDAMDRFTSTSGNFQEYLDATIEAGLTLMYDPSGVIGDYTTKFRPWEGGINLAAVIDYLFGLQVNGFDGTISLRPHLPAGWPEMSANDLRVGDARFDVAVTRTESGVDVRIDSHADDDLTVAVRWDGPSATTMLSVDGAAVDEETLVRRDHFGTHSVEVTDVALTAGASVTIAVE